MGAKLDSGGGGRGSDINADPNVIPFIDVMLVLLIIFMVTAPIASVDIQTDMPDSDAIASKREDKPVWVTLLDGEDCDQQVKGTAVRGCPAYFVLEEEVASDDLGVRTLEALRRNNPSVKEERELKQLRIYLRASGDTEFKNVMRVMNRLQDQGLTKVALVADDPTP